MELSPRSNLSKLICRGTVDGARWRTSVESQADAEALINYESKSSTRRRSIK